MGAPKRIMRVGKKMRVVRRGTSAVRCGMEDWAVHSMCACVLSMAFTGITIVVFCPSNVDTKMLQVMWQLCTLLPAPHSLLLNLSSPFLPLPSLTTRLCCHYLPSLQPYPVHQVSTERGEGEGRDGSLLMSTILNALHITTWHTIS